MHHVGTALNGKELKAMRELAEYIKANIEQQNQASLFSSTQQADMAIAACNVKNKKALMVDLKKLREESRLVTGIHDVYGKVYELFGFDQVISNPKRKIAKVNNLRHAVMGRIANPVSKQATATMLTEQYEVDISTSALYRMMDQIDDQVV